MIERGGEHLGMHTQILFAHQVLGNCVGQAAKAQLNGIAILNQISNISGDGAELLRDGRNRRCGHRAVCLDEVFHLFNGNPG